LDCQHSIPEARKRGSLTRPLASETVVANRTSGLPRVEVPGLAEARRRERQIRENAFLDLPQWICGIPVRHFTLRHLLILDQLRNGFVVPCEFERSSEKVAHALQFIWVCSFWYGVPKNVWQWALMRFRRWQFIRTAKKLNAEKVLCLYDVHIPYHSIEALTAAIDYGKKENVDCIFLGGDIIDCFKLSRFVKDPSKRNFAEELSLFKEFINVLEREFPKAKKIYKIGNHEERYQHFLFEKAKELVGVDEFNLDNIIKSRANNIEIVKDKRITNFNGLNIIHGHEFSSGFFSPVNVARGLYLRGKTSAIQGHSHQSSEHTESDMNGKITTTWSVGCLCELHPEYAPINKWNHGFAVLHKTSSGFDVDNKRIYKGKVL